ncbi:MAG: hypothetical protein A2430_01215 [Candidatus Liptonbacteria bacterium RIFOXYC1_FULL_36_8]|uniref:Uncharacterized protein n=2 Tax=Candidatus Liptoniibacteriota TaxID=1817909 RepID=A0A1G2CPF4_9BACT|nr:MAG: hypothetical protein A2390_01265 [Candidatus Liptonbacteria bacterium RIFOXYB1_FULL_36_10]OGZ03434.1 MAG: hypothetical protein A2430_01215 [Candidatus Liptonbacteria bacterium RIFOXYC1_FULL_36_8]
MMPVSILKSLQETVLIKKILEKYSDAEDLILTLFFLKRGEGSNLLKWPANQPISDEVVFSVFFGLRLKKIQAVLSYLKKITGREVRKKKVIELTLFIFLRIAREAERELLNSYK